jgi:predicted pyridoxine 5'-phosphate oxidase superfamily flavin-nucleotide-binding protein
MRLGFFVGFLIGAGVASLLSRTQPAEAPADVNAEAGRARFSGANPVEKLTRRLRAARQKGLDVLDGTKRHVREARVAAEEAAADKEAEMRLEFETEKRQTERDESHGR